MCFVDLNVYFTFVFIVANFKAHSDKSALAFDEFWDFLRNWKEFRITYSLKFAIFESSNRSIYYVYYEDEGFIFQLSCHDTIDRING